VTLIQHGSEGKGYQFLVRGFDAAHGADFEVSVDGMPINEWSNVHAQGYLDLGFVIPEVVGSVRVTKGPFTLDQGAFAVAGSADYHLGVAEDERGLRAAYTLSTTNRQRGVVTYSPLAGNGHDFIASETLHDDGFGSNRGVNKATLLARSGLAHSERFGELSMLIGGQLARFELPVALRVDDLDRARVDFRDSYSATPRGASLRALVALSYKKLGARHELRGVAYAGLRRLQVLENFTGYLFDREHGDFREQHQDALNFGSRLTLTSQLLPTLAGRLGLGVSGDVLDQQQAHVDSAARPLERERDLAVFQALSHALAGITLRLHPALRLDAGARLDVAHLRVKDRLDGDARGKGTLTAVSPRALLEWRVVEHLRMLLAYGRGFRPPEARAFSSFEPAEVGLNEARYTGGSPTMTTCESLELGARYRINEYLSAQASTFATFVAHESVYDHVSGLNLDLDGTRRFGAELSLRSKIGDFMTLGADTTLVEARFVASQNPVPFAPTLFGGARAALGRKLGPRAGLRFLAVAPRPLPHGATSSALTQLDLTAGYHWPVWRLDLELENLLNQRIFEGEFHFASHWQRSAPASNLPTLHYLAGPPLNARLTLSAIF
jgi:iron complex outermembrane recepter protein